MKITSIKNLSVAQGKKSQIIIHTDKGSFTRYVEKRGSDWFGVAIHGLTNTDAKGEIREKTGYPSVVLSERRTNQVRKSRPVRAEDGTVKNEIYWDTEEYYVDYVPLTNYTALAKWLDNRQTKVA